MRIRVPDPQWPTLPPTETDPTNFDWLDYLRQYPEGVLASGAARRNLSRYNPLLFALLYFRKHLTNIDGEITFSDFHLASCRIALDWARPVTEPLQYRDALVAPRETGKSTWWFLILPMWAAAHGHSQFLAAYSDTATQAERHLETFRRELDSNALLRLDYKELGEPSKRASTGRPIADNQHMVQTNSGFVFTAAGMDSGNLGLKVGNLRPDLLILDDVEPAEASYSLHQMTKRLGTVQDVIFPLNLNARVVITGTVTMTGSIIHQLVSSVTSTEAPAKWISDEKVRVRYFAPIIDEQDGTQRSLWPAKWPIEFLETIRHTRSYAKNFANQPVGSDGTYWTDDSFARTDTHEGAVATYLSIDPSVTGTRTSDYTGLSIVSYVPPKTPATRVEIQANPEGLRGTAIVRHASHVRMSPGPEFRIHVLNLLSQFPDTKTVLIETNQGGDTWKAILHDLPVPIVTVHQSVNKEVRAAALLTDYETRHVLHEGTFPDAENEMMSFPNGAHDDITDSIGTAVARLRSQEALRAAKKPAPTNTSTTYA